MTTEIPGSAVATASFEVPPEMPAACHLRIEHQNQTLRKLAAHLRTRGSGRQARDATAAAPELSK